MTTEWLPNLTTYYNRTTDMTNKKINIPMEVEMTDEEQAIIHEKISIRNKNLIESQNISVYEARSTYRDNKLRFNIELDDVTFEKEKTSKENMQEQMTEKPNNEKTEDSSVIPDASYWDNLANITINDLTNIAEDVIL